MTCQQFTTEELEQEIWRDIPAYEGFYSVSNLGRIRRDKVMPGCRAGRILKDHESRGYMRLMLRRNGAKQSHHTHCLVAAAFIGPKPAKQQVNHIDGNKKNNRLSNLEYLTAKENKRHAVRLGLVATGDRNGRRKHPESIPRGDRHHSKLRPECVARGAQMNRSNLTDAKVQVIRRLAARGISYSDIATLCDVTPQNIYYIVDRQTWHHVE